MWNNTELKLFTLKALLKIHNWKNCFNIRLRSLTEPNDWKIQVKVWVIFIVHKKINLNSFHCTSLLFLCSPEALFKKKETSQYKNTDLLLFSIFLIGFHFFFFFDSAFVRLIGNYKSLCLDQFNWSNIYLLSQVLFSSSTCWMAQKFLVQKTFPKNLMYA